MTVKIEIKGPSLEQAVRDAERGHVLTVRVVNEKSEKDGSIC